MKILNYLKEIKNELKHVSWPTRSQSIWFTAIVIIISLLVSFYLGFFDFIFSLGLNNFILNN